MAEVQEQFEQATQQQQQPKKANWWKRGVLIVAGGFVLMIGGCTALVGAVAAGSGASDTSEPTKVEKVEKEADVDNTATKPAPKPEPQPEAQPADEQPDPAPAPKPEPKPASKVYGVGETAQAGKMTWLVTSAYPTNQLEDIYGLEPPKRGNFVVVDFRFTNGANESVTLDTMHMDLKDAQGRTYEADTDTFSYVPSQKDIFLNQVNPGVTQKGMVIFTVAPDAHSYTFVADDVDFWEDDPAKYSLGF